MLFNAIIIFQLGPEVFIQIHFITLCSATYKGEMEI